MTDYLQKDSGWDRHGARFNIEVSGSQVEHDGTPAVLTVVQPLDSRRKMLAERDADALADLTTNLEFAREAPGEAPTDSGITVPRRAVETALATVGADPSRETVSGGRADVADLFRAAWSDAAPARATLTVEGSGDGSVPEQTPQPPALGHLAELLEWDVQIREPTDDTVVYSPHGVGATAGTDEG